VNYSIVHRRRDSETEEGFVVDILGSSWLLGAFPFKNMNDGLYFSPSKSKNP
jgi:hypothetical protein